MEYRVIEVIDADDDSRLLYVCGHCHAVVVDEALHDSWHQGLRDALDSALPLDG